MPQRLLGRLCVSSGPEALGCGPPGGPWRVVDELMGYTLQGLDSLSRNTLPVPWLRFHPHQETSLPTCPPWCPDYAQEVPGSGHGHLHHGK